MLDVGWKQIQRSSFWRGVGNSIFKFWSIKRKTVIKYVNIRDEKMIGCINLEFRTGIQVRDINLCGVVLWIIFKTMNLCENIKRVSVESEEVRTKDRDWGNEGEPEKETGKEGWVIRSEEAKRIGCLSSQEKKVFQRRGSYPAALSSEEWRLDCEQ